jgi:hypothetical protein
MAVSVFNKMRANNSDLADLNPKDFDISEARLNEALANITREMHGREKDYYARGMVGAMRSF